MSNKIIASAYLKGCKVEIRFMDGSGAHSYVPNAVQTIMKIWLGKDKDWEDIYVSLNHEVFEAVTCLFDLLYYPATRNHVQPTFVLSHNDFERINETSSWFVLSVVEDIRRAYHDLPEMQGAEEDAHSDS